MSKSIHHDVSADAPAYLIMVQPALVAQDIALTISDHAPQAPLLFVSSADHALRALESVRAVAVAYLSMDPHVFAESGLASAIRSRGGNVMLIGDAAEDVGAGVGWRALVRPFSIETVQATLAQIDA